MEVWIFFYKQILHHHSVNVDNDKQTNENRKKFCTIQTPTIKIMILLVWVWVSNDDRFYQIQNVDDDDYRLMCPSYNQPWSMNFSVSGWNSTKPFFPIIMELAAKIALCYNIGIDFINGKKWKEEKSIFNLKLIFFLFLVRFWTSSLSSLLFSKKNLSIYLFSGAKKNEIKKRIWHYWIDEKKRKRNIQFKSLTKQQYFPKKIFPKI